MREFAVAYEIVSNMSREKVQERLNLLRRYFLPFEKEISPELFSEIMVSSSGVSKRDLSLVRDKGIFFIHLYNLMLRKAKGEELVKEEEKEYALYQQYRDLLKRFPDVNIDHYDEEVIKFFSERHIDLVKEVAERRGIDIKRFSGCRAKPRLVRDTRGNYLYIKCYGEKNRDRAVARGTQEYIIPLYAVGVILFYGKKRDGEGV